MMTGMVILPVFLLIMETSRLGDTQDRTGMVMTGLAEHVRVFGRLPCPADETLGADDPNYAVEACAGITPVGGVLIGAVPVETLINAMDCGDRIGGTTPTAAEERQQGLYRKSVQRVKDMILDGTDPLATGEARENYTLSKTDCMRFDHMVDDYGNKFLYAVTEAATSSLLDFDINDPALGAITIEDANGNAATVNDQIFVVLSFGKDGKGALNKEGQAGILCTAGTGADVENCNRTNTTFVSAPINAQEGANFYDDHIDFSMAGLLTEQDYWSWNSTSNTDTPVEENIVFGGGVERIIIDQISDPSLSGVTAGDKLVVNRGDMNIDGGSLFVNSDAGVGGTLRVQDNIHSSDDMQAVDSVESDRYCYDVDCDGQ